MSKLVFLNGGRAFDTPSSPTEWDDFFEQCKQRPGTCPLLKHTGMDHEVTEYQVPLEMVRRVPGWSQSRVTDCHANHITELAKQIRSDPHGLRTGVCVLPNPEGYLDLCWGNNRLRAVQQNNENSFKMEGLADGHIWVTRYQYKKSELSKWQALENNIHPVSQSATPEDNVDSLKDMVDAGVLDDADNKFADCDDAEKRKRLRKIIKEVMPSSDPGKLINRFKRKNKSSFKLESYTQDEMKKKRFKEIVKVWNEPYDLTGLDNGTNSIIEKNTGRRIKVLFSHASSAQPGGAHLQTAVASKIVDKDHDEVWLVSAHNHVAEKDLARIRTEREAFVVKWNEKLKPHPAVIDRMIVLPQIVETEMQKLWVDDKRFS